MLSESYKKRIQELANILDENRLEKLVVQKFPQEIIDFSKKFAEKTTREPVTDDKINKNQYIPWIANELKRDPSIAEEKDKLSAIITWIKNSGYNKISANIPFEQVYSKAKTWLEKNTIDVDSGKRLEGGDILYTFPNGSQIVKVNNLNWCMRVGEKRGWCFSSEGIAKTFTGLDKLDSQTEGYMILDKNQEAKLALQYNKSTGVVDDYQGAFNKVPDESMAFKSIKLLGSLPTITDLKGHKETFWKTIKKYPKFSEAFKNLNNLNLNLERRWMLGIPFTKEEIKNMSMRERSKFGLLTKEDVQKLDPFLKNILAITFYPSDDEGMKGSFTPEQLGFDEEDIEFTKDFVRIDMTEDEYDKHYSGLGEDNDSSWIYKEVNYYDYYDEVDTDELDYMHHYINEENTKKLKDISKMLGLGNYNFEEEGNTSKFIENYFPIEIDDRNFKEDVLDGYLADLGYAIGAARTEAVNEYVDSQQKFKYSGGYLILPYKELYDFLISKTMEGNIIKSFGELKDEEINGEIELETIYYDAGTDEEKIVDLNKDFEYKIDKFIEFLEESGTGFKANLNKSIKILKSLGFNEENIALSNNAFIKIKEIDFENEKYKVKYDKYPEENKIMKNEKGGFVLSKPWHEYSPIKSLEGWVKFDDLTNYVSSEPLFEIRKIVRKYIKENLT